ncbi:MAG: hypothetical protein LBV40_00840 [Methanomicrobiales archaeon]|jgi:hypothetical protein|nr:hypothetical protein [Methanomicrobiales archaeon]
MFKLVDADIDGMMSRAKYIAILGLVCLCLFAAPAMAENKACSKCTPQTPPAFGTSCPAACVFELGEDFWGAIGDQYTQPYINRGFENFDLVPSFSTERLTRNEGFADLPGPSKLSNEQVAYPTLNPLVSKFSGHNVQDDLNSGFIKFKAAPIPWLE